MTKDDLLTRLKDLHTTYCPGDDPEGEPCGCEIAALISDVYANFADTLTGWQVYAQVYKQLKLKNAKYEADGKAVVESNLDEIHQRQMLSLLSQQRDENCHALSAALKIVEAIVRG